MQQAALLEAMRGYILILGADDGEAAENGVAVVAVVVNRVAAISVVRPYFFGEKLVLRFDRPVVDVLGVVLVLALHFLQKHDVDIEQAQMMAQFVHHHAPIEM